MWFWVDTLYGRTRTLCVRSTLHANTARGPAHETWAKHSGLCPQCLWQGHCLKADSKSERAERATESRKGSPHGPSEMQILSSYIGKH